MNFCIICNKNVVNEIFLSDGKMVHKSCLDSLQNEVLKIESILNQAKIYLENQKKELSRRDSITYKVFSFFSKPEITKEELEQQIKNIKEKLPLVSTKLSTLYKELSSIYDFYMSYPPDWDKRRELVTQRDGEACDKCGRNRILHLHHIIPLSRGGNNKVSNLKLLCEKCHSKRHGGRDFSIEFKSSETTFSKRIPIIHQAIQQRKRISFGYKKPSQKKYKTRTIMPKELVSVPHHHGNGSTLCIFGFCELRKANRHFALKRMKGLKIV